MNSSVRGMRCAHVSGQQNPAAMQLARKRAGTYRGAVLPVAKHSCEVAQHKPSLVALALALLALALAVRAAPSGRVAAAVPADDLAQVACGKWLQHRPLRERVLLFFTL